MPSVSRAVGFACETERHSSLPRWVVSVAAAAAEADGGRGNNNSNSFIDDAACVA